MYVNTLITLQENLTTYAVEGKKISGHVTINSPGLIKCYIQNLKRVESGQEYDFFAFSKNHNKGVKIGKLGSQKETRWKVNEKDVEGSGLKLEDLDAVAIVVENSMRGNDTVLMGYKNSRYMIIPLIDEIIKASSPVKVLSQKEISNSVSSSKLAGNKNLVQPDKVVEGSNPVSNLGDDNTKTDSLSLKENAQVSNNAGTTSINTESSIWQPGYQSTGQPGTIGSPIPVSQQTTNQTATNQMSTSTMYGNQSIKMQDTDMEEYSQSSNDIQEPEIENQGISMQIGKLMEKPSEGEQYNNTQYEETQYNGTQYNGNQYSGNQYNNAQNNMQQGSYNQGQNDGNNDGKAALVSSTFGPNVPLESIEDNESQLVKIAEGLPEVEKQPSIQTLGGSKTASSVREGQQTVDELEKIADEMAKELNDIVAHLRESGGDTEKLSEIEKQIELIIQTASRRKIDVRGMEETLENRYTSQKNSNGEDICSSEKFVEVKDEELDTSPKNALSYIHTCMGGDICKETHNNKVSLFDESKQGDIAEEVDYINEIDKKIKEIEERRKK